MHPLAKLAKTAVETFIAKGLTIKPPKNMPPEFLERKAGVFVTITKNGELRGCVGTYAPTQANVAQETINNAIEAATGDPRFEPVGKCDFKCLSYEVSLLEKPEPSVSAGNPDPKIYGIIVSGIQSKNRGLLLPGLKGIDTAEQQLVIACKKASIDPDKEKFRFTGLRQKDTVNNRKNQKRPQSVRTLLVFTAG